MDRKVVEVSSLSLSFSLFLSSLSLSFSDYLSTYLTYLPTYLPTYAPTYLPPCLPAYLPTSLSLSVCLSIYLSVYLQAWKRSYSARLPRFFNIKNAAIQRGFLIFWNWQRQKRSNSARLPHFLKLTTSKTKQFCETSFKNGNLSAEPTASCQCVLRFFDSTCLNYCACHEKVIPGHTKCCTCHAKSSQQTWRSDAPKCNPSQEISARTS